MNAYRGFATAQANYDSQEAPAYWENPHCDGVNHDPVRLRARDGRALWMECAICGQELPETMRDSLRDGANTIGGVDGDTRRR